MQAPTGSNMQNWHWVVVTDPDKRAAIAEAYREGARGYLVPAEGEVPDAEPLREGAGQQERVVSSARFLLDNIHRVPVHVIPCAWGRLPIDGDQGSGAANAPFTGTALHAGFWGSIFPAVWSFQLALRARGLGSSLTTFHLAREKEIAELLGIPYEKCTQTCLLPVGWTKGTDFKPAARKDADQVIHWDTW
jgi:nitroreductase